jgi:hypothetical protein
VPAGDPARDPMAVTRARSEMRKQTLEGRAVPLRSA